MTAWKKHNPNNNFLNSFGFTHDSKNYLFDIGSVIYEPIKLDLRPFGGSLVILTPFYKIDTGKSFDG
jgi:hypothetical protein